MDSFTFRDARSPSLLAAISAVLVIETAAIHLLFVRNHPFVAWSVTASSLALLVWLLLDYRRFRDGAVRLDYATLRLSVGLRFVVCIPRASIAEASIPTWREWPAPTGAYLNATKPATPNILLSLRQPITIRLFGVANRTVSQLGLCLDDPTAFLAALAKHSGAERPAGAT